MKQSSVVNVALMRNSLRRFWPLWLAGLVALVMLFDVPVLVTAAGVARGASDRVSMVGEMEGVWSILQLGSLVFAFVSAIVVALALNEHLFDSSAATFVGSLPVKRSAIYGSQLLAGLLVIAALPGLAALFLLPFGLSLGSAISLASVGRWYAQLVFFAFVFYATATLSCHLAGTRPVAVLLYLVVNLLASCLEAAVHIAVSSLMFGLGTEDFRFEFLSPFVWLASHAIRWDESVGVNLVAVGCGALVAVILLGAVGVLFKRRELEVAGDAVAVSQLRPVLKCLAGVSMALLFSSVFRVAGLIDAPIELPFRRGDMLLLAALMAVGAFLGVLFAEMIMSRTTHVLSRCWRSGLAIGAACAILVGACGLDVTGVAHRVPDPSEVESIELMGNHNDQTSMVIASPEQVGAACDLHRDIIARGPAYDAGTEAYTISYVYHLKGGQTLTRSYPVVVKDMFEYWESGKVTEDEGTQLLDRYAQIANSEEGRASRYAEVFDMQAKDRTVRLEYLRDDGVYATLDLTDAEAADLVDGALRHDLMEEAAGELFTIDTYSEGGYDATLQVFKNLPDDMGHRSLVGLQLDDRQCPQVMGWLAEHHPEIELMR